ncbi:MAG: hypothetical protein ACJ77Z_19425 [Thermoleophilaceae bacterium]
MNAIKGLIAAAIAMSLLLLPAGALAKGRDRDHDRMPDRWEKAHHLNPHAKDARKDADKDGLRNLSEYRHHSDPQDADTDDDGIDDNDEVENRTDPRKDDSDDDGVEDADEISGSIVSFENHMLTIQLPGQGAGTVAGAVNDATRVECDDDDDDARTPTAGASHDGSDDDRDNSGPGGDDNDDENENCTAADLKQGARVHEAKLATAPDGSKVFTKIELVPSA